jgi:two-component system, chemotaxis family, chemotaxis protein CheY
VTEEHSVSPRVLVVDDDESIRELISIALEDEGYEILQAHQGQAALEVVRCHPPDVILLDTRMPVMNGWEFARRYRELEGPHAPVIMFTAVDDPELAAHEIGAEAYLSKPFDLIELADIIRQQLERTH